MPSRAFVVGIPSTTVPGFADLRAGEDARVVATLLRARGFSVDSRVNGCTRDQFIAGLEDLRQATGAGDLAIIYVSGHGDRLVDTSDNPDEPADSHLILTDAHLSDDWFGVTFWPSVDKECQGSRWVTIADTCYSRTILLKMQARRAARMLRFAKLAPGSPQSTRALMHLMTPRTPDIWRLHIGASRDAEKALAVDPIDKKLSYATAALLRALDSNPHATYRQMVEAAEAEAASLRTAGAPLAPAPTLIMRSPDDRLIDSPAFRELTW